MSKEAHPNVNAVALMLGVSECIKTNLRGNAEAKKKDIEFKLLDESRKFAIKISDILDDLMEDASGS